jgi:hypothetical protein
MRNIKLEFPAAENVTIVNSKGVVLMRSHSRTQNDNISGMPIVKKALSGVSSDDTMEIDGVPYYMVGAPVPDDKNVIIGAVLFGVPFNQMTLQRWSEQFGAHWIFWYKDKIEFPTSSLTPLKPGIEKSKEVKAAFKNKLPKAEVVVIDNTKVGAAFGLPGQLAGKGGFIIMPKFVMEIEMVDIFSIAFPVIIAALLSILLAIIGSYLLIAPCERDMKLLCVKSLDAAKNQDASLLQPQTFGHEVQTIAAAIRDALDMALSAVPNAKRKPVMQQSGISLKPDEFAKGNGAAAVQNGLEPSQKLSTGEASATAASQLTQLVESVLSGDASQQSPTGTETRDDKRLSTEELMLKLAGKVAPSEPSVKAPVDNRISPALLSDDEVMQAQPPASGRDDEQELLRLMQEMGKKPTADDDGLRRSKLKIEPVKEPQMKPMDVKVTLHGGPGGLAAVKPEQSLDDKRREHYERTFEAYVQLRRQLGEPTEGLSKEKFFANLENNRQRMIEKLGCKEVRFAVVEKEGKASIKGSPIK